MIHPGQLLGLAPAPLDEADAVILPVPFERTVSYGAGTRRAPLAILEASCQVEVFDEETGVDIQRDLRLRTEPAFPAGEEEHQEAFLERLAAAVARLRGRFVLGLGGEHLVTWGLVSGLLEELDGLTIVQVDAHADLADSLGGERWSHGTVMRRLVERGARVIAIGVRSLSRAEHEFAASSEAISMHYAHELAGRWSALLEELAAIRGRVYLTIDADGLDPSVIPHVGTPQPDGLSWRQTMQVIDAVMSGPGREVIGADLVELVASPHPPGCDLIAAKLAVKVLAFRQARSGAGGTFVDRAPARAARR